MQEEVTGKSVALIIDGAKMSEQVLEKALQKFLEAQKNKSPKMHRGKQTLPPLRKIAPFWYSSTERVVPFLHICVHHRKGPGAVAHDMKPSIIGIVVDAISGGLHLLP